MRNHSLRLRSFVWRAAMVSAAFVTGTIGCGVSAPPPSGWTDVELRVNNDSQEWHFLFTLETPDGNEHVLPLLPPGAVYERTFGELTGGACPTCATLRVYVFASDPLSANEENREPMASIEEIVPLCDDAADPLQIALFALVDSPAGRGTLDIRRSSLGETAPFQRRIDFFGATTGPACCPTLAASPSMCMTGSVRDLATRNGVPGVGIHLRPLHRGMDGDGRCSIPAPQAEGWPGACITQDETTDMLTCRVAGIDETIECERPIDACGSELCAPQFTAGGIRCCIPDFERGVLYDCPILPEDSRASSPIDTGETLVDGTFTLCAPPGLYAVEPFGKGCEFRPGHVLIRAPVEGVTILAEGCE